MTTEQIKTDLFTTLDRIEATTEEVQELIAKLDQGLVFGSSCGHCIIGCISGMRGSEYSHTVATWDLHQDVHSWEYTPFEYWLMHNVNGSIPEHNENAQWLRDQITEWIATHEEAITYY